MNIKKIGMLSMSLLICVILFIILTSVQGLILNKKPKIEAFVAIENINSNTKLEEKYFKNVKIEENITEKSLLLNKIDENTYAKNTIHKGQILLKAQTATSEELKIINAQNGKEKISISLAESEDAISYQIKTGDKVNLYFTGKYIALQDFIPYTTSENKLHTIKVLENEEILGVFDNKGINSENESFTMPDTVVFAVTPDKAQTINNLRNQGTFDITGI